MDKETLNKKIEKLNNQINAINETWNFEKPWAQYERNMTPLWDELNKLHADLSLIEDNIEFGEIDGDHMEIKEFIQYCKDGGFMDSDGHGYYATHDKETSIQITPSWVLMGKIRKDFDYVSWYNK